MFQWRRMIESEIDLVNRIDTICNNLNNPDIESKSELYSELESLLMKYTQLKHQNSAY